MFPAKLNPCSCVISTPRVAYIFCNGYAARDLIVRIAILVMPGTGGTGMVASSRPSTFRSTGYYGVVPFVACCTAWQGQVIMELFRLLHAVLHGRDRLLWSCSVCCMLYSMVGTGYYGVVPSVTCCTA